MNEKPRWAVFIIGNKKDFPTTDSLFIAEKEKDPRVMSITAPFLGEEECHPVITARNLAAHCVDNLDNYNKAWHYIF